MCVLKFLMTGFLGFVVMWGSSSVSADLNDPNCRFYRQVDHAFLGQAFVGTGKDEEYLMVSYADITGAQSEPVRIYDSETWTHRSMNAISLWEAFESQSYEMKEKLIYRSGRHFTPNDHYYAGTNHPDGVVPENEVYDHVDLILKDRLGVFEKFDVIGINTFRDENGNGGEFWNHHEYDLGVTLAVTDSSGIKHYSKSTAIVDGSETFCGTSHYIIRNNVKSSSVKVLKKKISQIKDETRELEGKIWDLTAKIPDIANQDNTQESRDLIGLKIAMKKKQLQLLRKEAELEKIAPSVPVKDSAKFFFEVIAALIPVVKP